MSIETGIIGKVLDIRAEIECGGCGRNFSVKIDQGNDIPEGCDLMDFATDAVRGGDEYQTKGTHSIGRTSSVQGGYMLCHQCTRDVDAKMPEDLADADVRPEQVKGVLDN